MPEPTTAAGSFLGVKYASLIAGLAGGVVSLNYLKDLKRWQAILAVITGALFAGYATPFIAHIFGGIPLAAENSLAFILGLTSMNIIPGLIHLSEKFRDKPEDFIPKIKSGRDDDRGGDRRRDDTRQPSRRENERKENNITFPKIERNAEGSGDVDKS